MNVVIIGVMGSIKNKRNHRNNHQRSMQKRWHASKYKKAKKVRPKEQSSCDQLKDSRTINLDLRIGMSLTHKWRVTLCWKDSSSPRKFMVSGTFGSLEMVHVTLVQCVPVWGYFIEKMECANHCCKCYRASLEKLVQEKPSYKGKGGLTEKMCRRLTTVAVKI